MTNPCRFVSIALAAVDVPASNDGTHSATTHLAGLAMLIAERDDDDIWHFALERQAIVAGESESLMLLWAAKKMPESGTMIGWQLADEIVQPLLAAGTDSDPEIARGFLDRLMKLVTAPSVDLAIHHGGAAARPLVEIAALKGIAASSMTNDAVESAWALGERTRLQDHVSAQAIATWRLWLAESNGTATAATAAFEAWLG